MKITKWFDPNDRTEHRAALSLLLGKLAQSYFQGGGKAETAEQAAAQLTENAIVAQAHAV